MKLFSKIGVGKVQLVNDACNGCGKCNRVCDMQVDVLGSLEKQGQINSIDCIRCLKCTDECPVKAIAFRMGKQKGFSLSGEAAGRAEKASLLRRRLSAMDVVITAVWVGITLFFTFGPRQSAPQEIKIAMAAGLLVVIYGLARLIQKVIILSKKRRSEMSA